MQMIINGRKGGILFSYKIEKDKQGKHNKPYYTKQAEPVITDKR
jgi:hypothetical protein